MIHQSPSPRWFPAPFDVRRQMTTTSGVCLQMAVAQCRRADKRVEVIQWMLDRSWAIHAVRWRRRERQRSLEERAPGGCPRTETFWMSPPAVMLQLVVEEVAGAEESAGRLPRAPLWSVAWVGTHQLNRRHSCAARTWLPRARCWSLLKSDPRPCTTPTWIKQWTICGCHTPSTVLYQRPTDEQRIPTKRTGTAHTINSTRNGAATAGMIIATLTRTCMGISAAETHTQGHLLSLVRLWSPRPQNPGMRLTHNTRRRPRKDRRRRHTMLHWRKPTRTLMLQPIWTWTGNVYLHFGNEQTFAEI